MPAEKAATGPTPASVDVSKIQPAVTREIAGHKYGIGHRVGKLLGWAGDRADNMKVFTWPRILDMQKGFRTLLLGTALLLPPVGVAAYAAKKTYDAGVKYVPPVAFVDRKAKETAGAALNVGKDALETALYPAELAAWAGGTVLKAGTKAAVEVAKVPMDVVSDVETAINTWAGLPNEGDKKVNLPAQALLGLGVGLKKMFITGPMKGVELAFKHPYISIPVGLMLTGAYAAGGYTLSGMATELGKLGLNIFNWIAHHLRV